MRICTQRMCVALPAPRRSLQQVGASLHLAAGSPTLVLRSSMQNLRVDRDLFEAASSSVVNAQLRRPVVPSEKTLHHFASVALRLVNKLRSSCTFLYESSRCPIGE